MLSHGNGTCHSGLCCELCLPAGRHHARERRPRSHGTLVRRSAARPRNPQRPSDHASRSSRLPSCSRLARPLLSRHRSSVHAPSPHPRLRLPAARRNHHAGHSVRTNHNLWCNRPRGCTPNGEAPHFRPSRRTSRWTQPDCTHRPLPSRRWTRRPPDGIRRWTRTKTMASQTRKKDGKFTLTRRSAFRTGGRYWTRTSDPYRVKVML